MPDINDLNDFGFGPGGDFGHDHNPDPSDDHSFFGHGGFVNANHFEWSEPKQSGGNIDGLGKFLLYFAYLGGIVIIGLLSFFIIFR